jgi:hypothetical protein
MTKFKTHSLAALGLLSLVAMVFPSCTEDYFDMDTMQEDLFEWNPDLAIPLVFSSLSAADIVGYDENNYYTYGDDSFITLVYTRTVFSETLNDFLEIPGTQGLNQSISLDGGEVGSFISSGQVQKIVNVGFPMAFNGTSGSQLNRLVLESGSLTIGLISDFQHSGSLLVTLPELRLNGVSFSQSIPINYTGGLVSQNITVDLAGYELDLDNGGPTNTLPIIYTLNLQDGGGADPTTANSVAVTQGFSDLVLAFADGYFGQFALEIPGGVVQMDLLDDGVLYFEDPRMRLTVKNTIGVPIQVAVQQLYGEGQAGTINFNYSQAMPNPFTIAAAPALGDSSIQSFYFTRDNSNINQLVNGNFNSLHHDFDSQVNANGQVYNFASRNSVVEVKAEAELPFWGKSNHFIVEDTLEYPLGELSNIQGNIERGLLRINTVNGFPMDGILKLYLTDSLYNVIDSILADGSFVLRSGPIDANGKVITPVNTNNDVPIDSARVASIFGAKYMIIHGDMISTNDAVDNIRIYGDDRLQVRIGLQVKLKASPSDLEDL